ncbi:MAG: hypothetical protein U9O85_01495 [Euryarchaeota archaeon]|nr:hypothetical protein [Euryarchaeota archaeon]
MNKNLIDYVAIPKKEINVEQSQILSIKAFLKGFNFHKSRDWYNFINEDENIEISISKTGIVAITLRIYPEDTEKAISLLDKISKKICSFISDKDFSIEISILEKRKIDMKYFIDKEIDIKEFRSMNFKVSPEIKMRISSRDEEHIISFRESKEVNRLLNIYSLILNGKELRELTPTEVDVTITKSVF